MTRVSDQPAYVLHRRAYRDSSQIVEVLTRDAGRIGLIARGARKGRRAGRLEPFRPLTIGWSRRGELGTLTDIETPVTVPPLSGRALACGFYLNELVTRLVDRDEPLPELFAAYAEGLHGLLAGQAQAPLLRRFELRLLEVLGYGLLLDRDARHGEPVQAGRDYLYRFEEGPVPWDGSETGGLRVRGETLLELAAGRPGSTGTLREARRLLEWVLAQYLGPRPLKSRELLEPYRRGPGSAISST